MTLFTELPRVRRHAGVWPPAKAGASCAVVRGDKNKPIRPLGPATLENLCAYIWRALAPVLPGLAAVKVWRAGMGDSCTLRLGAKR